MMTHINWQKPEAIDLTGKYNALILVRSDNEEDDETKYQILSVFWFEGEHYVDEGLLWMEANQFDPYNYGALAIIRTNDLPKEQQ
jgi:hypothetical protein